MATTLVSSDDSFFTGMDVLSSYPRLASTLIAPASGSAASTLLVVFQMDASGGCEVREQLADGENSIWPDSYPGRSQPEAAIYRRFSLHMPLSPFSAPGSLRIIVADDHEWIRQILVQVVHNTLPTATVIEVEDGLQAFNAYREGGCHFLVSNHTMPHMDGPTLIRKVHQQAPDLPVVMVSIHPEAKADAEAAGANWFLTKEEITERLPGLLRQYAVTSAERPAAA